MTFYKAGGARMLGPYFPPAERARPHLCEHTYEGGVTINGVNIVLMPILEVLKSLCTIFEKKTFEQKYFLSSFKKKLLEKS